MNFKLTNVYTRESFCALNSNHLIDLISKICKEWDLCDFEFYVFNAEKWTWEERDISKIFDNLIK